VQWLGSNLVPAEGGGLVWTFDVEGARGMLESYRRTDLWEMLRHPPLGTTIHVVRALDSDRCAVSPLQFILCVCVCVVCVCVCVCV
jgi:hypothetical protein